VETGTSMVMGRVTKTNGVPPAVGVAVIRKPGFVPSVGAETPVTSIVPFLLSTVAS